MTTDNQTTVGSNFREEGLAVKRERRAKGAKGAKGQKQRKGKTNTHYYFWSFRTQLGMRFAEDIFALCIV